MGGSLFVKDAGNDLLGMKVCIYHILMSLFFTSHISRAGTRSSLLSLCLCPVQQESDVSGGSDGKRGGAGGCCQTDRTAPSHAATFPPQKDQPLAARESET